MLLTRSRATNLVVVALACFATVSLLLNLNLYYSRSVRGHSSTPPASILSTLQLHSESTSLTHLIIVAAHAIWTGNDPEKRQDESEWALESYQRGGGRVKVFFEHISRGVELAMQNERALLIFSGGRTKEISTTSEAESYLRLAIASNLFQPHTSPGTPLFARATTEEDSLDSYQNLLFSIARFHEYTGRYPNNITVVGYGMKRRRFTELHRMAIRWPDDKFHYVGIDPDLDFALARQDEMNNGYFPFTTDLYGCHSFLLAKRKRRNHSARFHSFYTSSPELRGLLDWCPGVNDGGHTALYDGSLPWR